MIYTQEQIGQFLRVCYGCNERAEQYWVDVTDPPYDKPELFVRGRWTCWTVGCEYGPPTRPDGCTCTVGDTSTLGDEFTRWQIFGDPNCTAHMPDPSIP